MPTIRPRSFAAPSLAVVLLLTAAARAQAPKPLPEDRSAGAAAVNVEQCRQWLGTLASPEFEGRGTGQPGFQKAADFVAEHFRSLHLEARGDKGSYFQTVPWAATNVVPEKTFVSFGKDGKELVRIPAARLTGTVSAALSAKGDVVLLSVPVSKPVPAGEGRGMVLPDIKGLDDLDVKDRVVVVQLQAADAARGALAATRFAVRRGLQGKEAAAVLFAQNDAVADGLRGSAGAQRRANPAAAASGRSPVDVTFGGDDLKAVLGAANGKLGAATDAVVATPLDGVTAELEIAVAEGQAPAMNVFAVLPGSDPKLKDEYVVIGSHLDHLGKRGDRIHPGADDDGSGTTGVMAVAKMFVTNGLKPKRSVLFVCFCGEEVGLVGSEYFAKNPPIPLSSIAAELQMDMIGRDEEESAEGNKGEKAEQNRNSVHLVGTQKLAPALHDLCLAKNATAGFDIEYDEERMFGRSDHANFAAMGVPIAFFFTGLHRDYHQVTDTPDKIHYEKLLGIARWVYDIAFELALQPTRPEIDPKLWATYRGKGTKTPAAPMLPGKDADKDAPKANDKEERKEKKDV